MADEPRFKRSMYDSISLLLREQMLGRETVLNLLDLMNQCQNVEVMRL